MILVFEPQAKQYQSLYCPGIPRASYRVTGLDIWPVGLWFFFLLFWCPECCECLRMWVMLVMLREVENHELFK